MFGKAFSERILQHAQMQRAELEANREANIVG